MPTPKADRERFCIGDEDVLTLADYAIKVEEHYSARAGVPRPMDIEWAKDGGDGQLYLVQARPETVASQRRGQVLETYALECGGEVLAKGGAVGEKIAAGNARVVAGVARLAEFRSGEVLVADITTPDWEPVMKTAAAIVTNRGGRTCHAAIVARELGIPAVVGCEGATASIPEGAGVTVSCAEGNLGKVYRGEVPFRVGRVELEGLARPATEIMINLGNPELAFKTSFLPNDGVGLSDFKTNEYASLLGGKAFEPSEANPMIGFRGAARYAHPAYAEGFALECAAMKRVRDEMGLVNVKLMVPFARRIPEAEKVLAEMARHGLERGRNGLEIYVMCEIPNNVLQIDAFARLFDGFSIGSNDLTQLTLGVDRDSELVAFDYDERDPGMLEMLRLAVEGAKRNHRHVGICGQAPSDYPEIAERLVELGIDSLSLNPDAVLKTALRVLEIEKRLGRAPRPA